VHPNSIVLRKRKHDMREFHSIAALCGDGLRPELRELFDRLAVDPNSELFVRHNGMLQSGPDPKSEAGRGAAKWATDHLRRGGDLPSPFVRRGSNDDL
jgi:hypothetical protein